MTHLQRLLLPIVRDAVHAQPRLRHIESLPIHNEPRHERHRDGLPVQLRRHPRRLRHILTVHEPEARRHRRREGHTLVHIGEGRVASDVLPLGGR